MADAQTDTKTAVQKNDPVRPAIILDSATLRTSTIFLEHFLAGMTTQAYVPVVVCPPDADTSCIPSPPASIIYYPAIKLPLLWTAYNRKRLFDDLLKQKPTILHCIGTTHVNLTAKLAQRMDLPYLLMIESLPKSFIPFSVSPARCAAILSPVARTVTALRKKFPALAERVSHLRLGTFIEDTCACFESLSRIPGIVMAGPLISAADFEQVLKAVKHLAIEANEFVLAVIGSGPAQSQIRKIVKTLGLTHIVSMLDNVRSIRSVFAGADIFIQPGPIRTFNACLLEAMSVGMAIAANRNVEDELLIDDLTVVRFDCDDELSIYAALQKLLNQREFARNLALNSQAELRKAHTVTQMIDSIIRTYQKSQDWIR
ncbi:MAG: glycosyltransferase family 4 protein [Planctomycetota bacterium]